MPPDSWIPTRLGELGQLRNGVNFSREQEGYGLPVLKVKDFGDLVRCPLTGLDELDSKAVAIPPEQYLANNDVVVIRSNGNSALVGRSVLVLNITQPTTFSGFCIRFRADNSRADPQFLAYYLRSPVCRSRMSRFGSGTGIQNLNQSILAELPIDLPSLSEQHAVAGVLGAIDDKIESNRRINRKLEQVARTIFRAWFVDFEPVKAKAAGARFFSGMPQEAFDALPTRFTESGLGPIPEGWQTTSLFDTATYVNGAAFNASHFCDTRTGLPIIKIAELKSGIDHQTRYSKRSVDPKQRIDTGDLVYSWSGSPDTSLDVFLWTGGPGLLNQHIFKVITLTTAQKRFVYYLLRHLRSQLVEIARNKQTTGLGHVTVKDMKRLMVVRASDSILGYFDTVVGPIFDRCFCYQMESIRLEALRDYLLPKLLSGEIRVADAERSVS